MDNERIPSRVERAQIARDSVGSSHPTLIHALRHAAVTVPERTAIIAGSRELSYARYARAAAGFARQLRAEGLEGQRVAISMANGIELAVALLGTFAARAQAAPFNPLYTETELTKLLRDVGARLIVTDPHGEKRCRDVAAALAIPRVLVFDAAGGAVAGWASDPCLALPEPLPGAGDRAVMFFTGGSTGVPKGAQHTHASIFAHAPASTALWPFAYGAERFLNVVPLSHIWGFVYSLCNPIYLAATLDVMAGFKPAAVLAEIEARAITVFAGGPPTLYAGLRGDGRYRATDFSRLKYGLTGGAPCPEALGRAWLAETKTPLLEAYGMSEGAPFAVNPLNAVRKPRSAGLPPPLTVIEIVDVETGKIVQPQGRHGEIRVRGPQVAIGYCGRPDETAIGFRDGWLYTGDIGYLDDDGYLFIVDRKKDMVLVSGFSVYPREIDETILAHPAVLEAATVGAPNSYFGEVVHSFVVLKPGMTADVDELRAHCRKNLAVYKVPRNFEFVTALPRNGVGKIDKLDLKARAAK